MLGSQNGTTKDPSVLRCDTV